MKTNRAGVELIKSFEGLRTTSYLCPANVWTIGYGHTSAAGAPPVAKGMKITADQADDILVADLAKYEAAVLRPLKRVPNENQFAAMVSLCFNIGAGGFASSSVVRRFNEGNIDAAGDSFLLWNKATVNGKRVVLSGLTRRRQAERALFLKPVEAIPKPSAPTPAPKINFPPVEAPNPKQPPSIQTVMAVVVAAIIAAVAGWLKFGG